MPSLNKRDSPTLGPIDLDMFNADSTAVGGQPQTAHINVANSSFLSSLPPNFTGVPTIASTTGKLSPEPQLGYHPLFGHFHLCNKERRRHRMLRKSLLLLFPLLRYSQQHFLVPIQQCKKLHPLLIFFSIGTRLSYNFFSY